MDKIIQPTPLELIKKRKYIKKITYGIKVEFKKVVVNFD